MNFSDTNVRMDVQLIYGTHTVPFEIDLNWDVFFLKQRACQLFELQPGDVDVYFDYKRLDDDLKLSETGVSNGSCFNLIKRGLRNSNFVYCYTCETVCPALVILTCDDCKSTDFLAIHIDGDMKKATGKCQTTDCTSTTASTRLACLENPTHEPTVLLSHVKRNFTLQPCIACLADNCELIVKFCENQQHILCVPCFRFYANEYLENGLFELVESNGFTLGCPAGCTNAVISDPHHFRILGKEFYTRYKEFAAAKYLNLNNSVVCPRCNQQWDISHGTARPSISLDTISAWYTCERPVGCGCLFCARCSWYCVTAPSNLPASCLCGSPTGSNNIRGSSSLLSQFKSIWWKIGGSSGDSATDTASRNLIANICRPCPHCKSSTEKSNGCNHIHCSICGTDWCWICYEVWTHDCQSLHWF